MVADKADSQDICFVPQGRYSDVIERLKPGSARPGEIVHLDGRVLGRHAGIVHYTVGQRRGLGLAADEPLYVLAKEPAENRIVVGPRGQLSTARVYTRAVRLYRPAAAVDRVKLRYRAAPVACRIEGELGAGDHDRATLVLEAPVDGAAPGQTACLMRGDAVVGVAVVAGSDPADPADAGAVGDRGGTTNKAPEALAHAG